MDSLGRHNIEWGLGFLVMTPWCCDITERHVVTSCCDVTSWHHVTWYLMSGQTAYQLIKIWSDQKKEKQNQNQQKKIELPKKEPCQHLISSKLISSTESIYACANMAVLYIIMVFIHKKICIFVFSLLMSKVMFSHLEKRGIQVRWSYVIRKRHVTGKLSWAWIMSNCQHSEILC